MTTELTIGALLLLLTSPLSPVEARDPAQVRAFRADHACPGTNKTRGACPGWVVDHQIPLCAGGPDLPSNMIWQSKASSLVKDRIEWALCRRLKSCPLTKGA